MQEPEREYYFSTDPRRCPKIIEPKRELEDHAKKYKLRWENVVQVRRLLFLPHIVR